MKNLAILFIYLVSFSASAQIELVNQANKAKEEGKTQEAYDLYAKAAEGFLANNALLSYVETHLEMVNCQLQMSDPFQAKNLAINTLDYIQSEIESPQLLEAKAYTLLGLSFLNLGRGDEALNSLLEAEKRFNNKESIDAAKCYGSLGLAYRTVYNNTLAIQYHEKALRLWRKLKTPDAIEVGNEFNNLGLVYTEDNPTQALIYFNRALTIYKKQLGENHRKVAVVITNMALSNNFLENYDKAVEQLNQVEKIYENTYSGDHPNKAFILSSIGRVQVFKGEIQEALLSQNKALEMYIRMFGEKHPDVANTYFLIGDAYLKNGDFLLANQFYQQSIFSNFADQHSNSLYDLPKLENYFNADILLSSLRAKAVALEALHYEQTLNTRDLKGAIYTYKHCDELITIIRRQRMSEQDKIKLGATAKEVYENGIRLSLILSEQSFKKREYLNIAFEFCERSKAAVLLEAITESKAKEFSGIPAELIALEDSIKDEISFLERKLAEPETTEDQQLKDLIFTYQSEYRKFISQLEKQYPEYYNLKYNHQIVKSEDVRNKLNEQTAVLSYFIGEDQLYVFVVSQKNVRAYIIPKIENFEKQLTAIRNAIKYDIESAFFKSSHNLYNQLIPRLPSYIKELVIIPDGILGTIPFEALISNTEPDINYANAKYLISNYEVSYEYSASLFVHADPTDIGKSPEILLVAPVDFNKNDTKLSSLPGSAQEVQEIKYLFQGNNCKSTVREKSNASEASIKLDNLAKYNYLHFATHGIVNESEPALSRIFLQPNSEEDGSLYTGEIYNLKINADLVTLSACETGLGKLAKGEGVVGLSRALQYAGANNVIVSLWQVADASTSQMMIEFYKYNLNNRKYGYNTALRNAKLYLLNSEEYNHPYYWAPFILVGI